MIKPILTACCLSLASACGLAQGTSTNSEATSQAGTNAPIRVTAAEARKHVGADVIVTAKVAEMNKIERLVRLNLEKPYPDVPLTVIIFSDKTNLFPELDMLKGQTIEVSGMITEYHGRPEIILNTTNQVKIIARPTAGNQK